MVYQSPKFDFVSLFEEREKEIDAARRSGKETLAVASTAANERIRHHVIEQEGRPIYIIEMQGRKVLRSLAPDSDEGIRILSDLQKPGLSVFNLEAVAADAAVDIDPLLSHVQEVAAVSGRLEPNDLVPKETPEETRKLVLSRLAPQCSVETYEGTVRWLLSPTSRSEILRALNESGRLGAILAGPLPSTDRFGEILRELLKQGENFSIEGRKQEELLALIAAIDAVVDSGLPHPDVTTVRKALDRKEFLSEYDVLLSRGFVGRTQELAYLHNFLDARADAYTWSSLVMTGFGGAGKSTLLAKFARDVFAQKLATVVILDFDRPGIDAKDFYWLEQEISRQVGRQYPEGEEYLRQRRREERQFRAQYVDAVSQRSADAVEAQRSSHSIMYDVRRVLEDAGADTRPFLLVLDTYEQIEDQDLSDKVFEWLYELSSALGLKPLKVIFSGRLYDSSRDMLERHSNTTALVIGEMTQPEAEQVLLNNNVPAPIAARLAYSELLPRRPLELTLLARLTTDFNKNVDELEAELRAGGASAKELFAGLVYRRVLRRLQDPIAEKLAYPGLVLRYVTADLIRNVLGPALGLPPFSDAEADDALNALASASWLVNRQNNEVWHRPDLRNSTLKAMIAAEPKTAEKISKAAIEFFESQNDERSRAEAVYHRLMLMKEPQDGEQFELAELKKANVYIRSNVGDLPSVAATLLKFAVEGNVPVTEVECLPKIYLESAYSQAGTQLVMSRLFGKALKLYDRRHPSTEKSSALQDWEIETLFATASWDRLKFSTAIKIQKEEGLLRAVVRTLYPALVISSELLSDLDVGAVLETATKEPRNLEASLHGPEGQETLRQLVVSLIYATAQGDSDKKFRTAAGRILEYRRKFTDQPIAPVTERRMMLLERVMNGGASSEVRFSISTLCLDLPWMGEFQRYLKRNREDVGNFEELDDLLHDVAETLTDPPGRGVRSVLGEIDSLSKAAGVVRGTKLVASTDNTSVIDAVQFLRGPSPEFRDPCRYALLDAFPDRQSLYKLGEIISSLTQIHADVGPESFANTLAADPEHGLTTYVELIDRSWKLGDLLREAASKVVSSKLDQVLSAFRHWDEALTATIRQGFFSHQ